MPRHTHRNQLYLPIICTLKPLLIIRPAGLINGVGLQKLYGKILRFKGQKSRKQIMGPTIPPKMERKNHCPDYFLKISSQNSDFLLVFERIENTIKLLLRILTFSKKYLPSYALYGLKRVISKQQRVFITYHS